MKCALVLALVLFGLVALGSANPGFKVTLTQNGLNYARGVAMQYLQQKFATVHVPDQGGDAHAPVIGKINWQLQNIVISGLSLPQSSIAILPGRGVSVNIAQASLEITMDFHYREHHWPHIKGHGNLVIHGSGINIGVAVQVGEANGKPTLAVISSQCSIGNLSVKEHGGPSWLYNFFLKVLHNAIKNAAEKAVGSAIQNLLNDGGNRALQTIPFTEQFAGIAEVDYSLVSGPTFGPNYLTINSKGEFYYLPHKTPMPDEVNGDMMQIMLSDFVPDSASFVFRESGKMTAFLKDKDLPSWSPIRLNTNSWAHILPQLPQKYPNMEMQAEIVTTSPPTASFAPQGIQVAGPGQIIVSVLPASGSPVNVFALNIQLSTSAKVTVQNGRIYADLTYLNSPVTVAYSNVGTINVSLFDNIIKTLSTDAIVPFFNYYLSHGINIPTIKGVTLINPTIVYGQGYLAIATDISYAL
ncbi:LBP / BPI / CETP family, Cterminal domain containing protein [Acanthamoeba castellanii str. Neff]|uniref:LBP / BPI / CETP family, Cterminal domain containing protein n=1 Tax=Acanthamoeba castellanii (strain ATCC 30010 / Neff) TaxID=1257118 RepID=L8GVZ7_ACACF|nr:LBP / BPI / CETP family, Cterminal domain containing protein [Acanthamoeba castellanii str. Neff]ELR16783.1 LBP / BPI / CETP family, Cterminal domain containing protein [Acanthamoeba castellanii str. Neff]